MSGAPIRFRGSRSRVSDNPRRAGLTGSSGSAVRRDTTEHRWCRCLATARRGRCPSRWSVTCRSHGGCGAESAADGRALVGTTIMGHLQAAPGCSRSTSLSLPVRGVVLPIRKGRASTTYGCGTSLCPIGTRRFPRDRSATNLERNSVFLRAGPPTLPRPRVSAQDAV